MSCANNLKILAVRNVEKGNIARQDIIASIPGLDSTTVEVWKLDLADFSSVKAFAERASSQLPRLDVLLCNAGIAPAKWEFTKDRWETTSVIRFRFRSLVLC